MPRRSSPVCSAESKVLSVIFGKERFTVKEISRMTFLAEHTVRRIISDFEKRGIISAAPNEGSSEKGRRALTYTAAPGAVSAVADLTLRPLEILIFDFFGRTEKKIILPVPDRCEREAVTSKLFEIAGTYIVGIRPKRKISVITCITDGDADCISVFSEAELCKIPVLFLTKGYLTAKSTARKLNSEKTLYLEFDENKVSAYFLRYEKCDSIPLGGCEGIFDDGVGKGISNLAAALAASFHPKLLCISAPFYSPELERVVTDRVKSSCTDEKCSVIFLRNTKSEMLREAAIEAFCMF